MMVKRGHTKLRFLMLLFSNSQTKDQFPVRHKKGLPGIFSGFLK
jgi:hypothetical protein